MSDPDRPPIDIATDRPSPARLYDYALGGKDNFAVDREAGLIGLAQFPEAMDIARENRLFLYRVVRYLARDAEIRQYLDMGSGLPTQDNVHQVAQRFQPDAHVVYVDNDPIVLAHGRALLADERTTTVIQADMTEPRDVLAHDDTRRLIDFDWPVAALFMSIGHSIPEDRQMRDMLATVARSLCPGSFLAASQIVTEDAQTAARSNEVAAEAGLAWKTRTVDEFAAMLAGLGMEPVEPGLLDVSQWRPDPGQPPLRPVPQPLRPYLGAAARDKRVKEFGGLLRKP